MREYFTLHRSVFPSYLTIESGRIGSIQGHILSGLPLYKTKPFYLTNFMLSLINKPWFLYVSSALLPQRISNRRNTQRARTDILGRGRSLFPSFSTSIRTSYNYHGGIFVIDWSKITTKTICCSLYHPNPSIKFHCNLLIEFWGILLKDKETNKQTNATQNIIYLVC